MALDSGLTVSARKTSSSGGWRCGLFGGHALLGESFGFQKA